LLVSRQLVFWQNLVTTSTTFKSKANPLLSLIRFSKAMMGSSTYLTPTLHEVEPTDAPTEALQVLRGIKKWNLLPFTRLYSVDPAFYTWELEQRKECLGAPSINHLCTPNLQRQICRV
jgi:hypothetical protein